MARQDKIGSTATTVTHTPLAHSVKYHDTVVIQWNSQGITLNSGGWKTATTKTRINQASAEFDLGICVYQEKRKWFVTTPQGETVPFVDGMRIERKSS